MLFCLFREEFDKCKKGLMVKREYCMEVIISRVEIENYMVILEYLYLSSENVRLWFKLMKYVFSWCYLNIVNILVERI